MVSVIHLVGVDLSVFSEQDLLLILKLMHYTTSDPINTVLHTSWTPGLYLFSFCFLIFLILKYFFIPLEETEGASFIT